MRIKEYKTFEWYESREDWVDELITVDLDMVCAVKEYKWFKNENKYVRVYIPGECFVIEMAYNDFCKDWVR